MKARIVVVFLALHQTSSSADTRADKLEALARSMPDVRPTQATEAARAALIVETAELPAELLLAIAWGESRFDPTVVTGKACGPMQTIPSRPDDCARWRDPVEGFRAGRDELADELMHDHRVHGDLRLALLAYACGNSVFDGTCKKLGWPSVIIERAKGLGWRPRSGRTAGSS